MMALEVAVQDVNGALLAQRHGAARVELCSALALGGLTPSLGAVRAAVGTGIDVRVLVRAVAGGFRLAPQEIDVLADDVELSVAAGAAGVVVGALREPRQGHWDVDTTALAALADVAVRTAAGRSVAVVVHRCVDVLLSQHQGDHGYATDLVHRLVDAGVTGMLTSGGAGRCRDNVETLRALVETAPTGFEVIAGGGVRAADIPALREAGVPVVHLSARSPASDRGPAGAGGGSTAYDVTDAALLMSARAAVESCQGLSGHGSDSTLG